MDDLKFRDAQAHMAELQRIADDIRSREVGSSGRGRGRWAMRRPDRRSARRRRRSRIDGSRARRTWPRPGRHSEDPTMRVGLQLPSFTFPGGTPAIRPTLTSIAQAAEANGFASLWVMDHFFQLPVDSGWGGPDEPMLEAYTTLGFLAHATERIALGPMVVERRRPAARPARQGGHVARRPVRRPDVPGHRCRLVRTRGERPRAAMADARRTVRTARGDAPHRARDVVG